MKEMLTKAAKKHGDTCIGLAIGIRAAHLASSVFDQHQSAPDKITCGTKQCIAEAFETLYSSSKIQVSDLRDDRIVIKSRGKSLAFKLTPRQKANFLDVAQVLKAPDKILFESAELLSQ